MSILLEEKPLFACNKFSFVALNFFLLYFYIVACGCDYFCTSPFVALYVKTDKEMRNLTTNDEFSNGKIMFVLR